MPSLSAIFGLAGLAFCAFVCDLYEHAAQTCCKLLKKF